jgi:cytochrome P450
MDKVELRVHLKIAIRPEVRRTFQVQRTWCEQLWYNDDMDKATCAGVTGAGVRTREMLMTTTSLQQKPGAPMRTPPTIGRFPLGVLPDFRRDPLALYVGALQTHRDLVRMRFGSRLSYTLFHPDLVKHVLVDNNRNYIRNRVGNELLKEIIGLNLLTSDGDFWLRQRRLMQPAFHRQRIAGFGPLITASAAEMLARWEQIPAGEYVDIAHEMMQATLQIVGRALFSVDLLNDSSGLGRSIEVGAAYFTYRLGRLFAPPLWVPTKLNREYKATRAAVLHIVPDMIAARRQRMGEHVDDHAYDMLDLLLESRYEDTGQPMSDEQLATEIRMFIAAGHETTSNTLTWTLYLLSQHPAVEATLHGEIARVLAGRTPTMADLPELTYTKMVIDEAMRLYPAAWILARQSLAADQLGDYALPAGTGLTIPIYALHRHPDFWSEPEVFDPERFAANQVAARHKYAFIPFGSGPRLCIGSHFALAEAQLILAMIAQRYQLRLKPGYQVVPEPLVTLRVKGGLPMQMVRRG